VLDRRAIPAGEMRALPDNRLHGLRGIDMSGVELDGCFVPDSALVGAEGHGLEIALKSTHPVRVLITSVAIGCTDTALRLTLDFARARRIGGRPVLDIPYSRRQLTEAFADILLCDVLANTAARALQAVPGQSSIWSATTKYLVPTVLDRTGAELAVVLGARHYLRDHPRFGPFQKARRDMLVANFADGNTTVNLKNIAIQLESLLATALNPPAEAETRFATLFDWDAALPGYHPDHAGTVSRSGDDALLALPFALRRLRELADRADHTEAERWQRCVAVGEELHDELRRLSEACADLRSRYGPEFGSCAELFRLAERFCVLHAAATCLAHRAWSAGWVDAPLDTAAALLVTLDRLWRRLYPMREVADAGAYEDLATAMTELHGEARSFGYRMFRLPDSPFLPDNDNW
jgi:hypothetical protein